MNWTAIKAIYAFEMARFFRTITQSIISPVLSTSLYFVVFGAAIGSRIEEVEGVSYGAFIVPGLIMLSVITQSISNASFGIYFPKFIGTVYELLSAPINFFEIVIGYVGAAATKALFIGTIILITAFFFVDITIQHPIAMVAFLILTCISFETSSLCNSMARDCAAMTPPQHAAYAGGHVWCNGDRGYIRAWVVMHVPKSHQSAWAAMPRPRTHRASWFTDAGTNAGAAKDKMATVNLEILGLS
jgi:ABC-type multidrug transport system permease subunit